MITFHGSSYNGVMETSIDAWLYHLRDGTKLYTEKDYPAAIRAFNKSVALHEHWRNCQFLGLAHLHTKNYSKAIEAFNKSILLREHWQTYQGLGTAFFQTNNNFPAAIEAFTKSIALKKHWFSYQSLGSVLFCTRNYLAAIESFDKSIALNKHWKTYQHLGAAFFQLKKYPEAIEAYNKSIDLNQHWKSCQGLGSALFFTKNYPAAINAFKMSITLEEHWNSYQGLGLAFLRSNNFKEAIDAFNKSIALNEHWNSYQGLSLALFHEKKYRLAIDAINTSFEIIRNHATEKQSNNLYLMAINEGKIDPKFLPFLESKESSQASFFKEYLIAKSKSSSIDPLVLRKASLTISAKDKPKSQIKPTEKELIDRLGDFNSTGEINASDISTFHRYIFGVSHSRLHLTSPNTTVIGCGAGTMFSIGNPKSRTKHFHKIHSAIEAIKHNENLLIFEFGEIDIRNHIFKISKKKSQSIYTISDTSISRYINFIKTLQEKGFEVLVIGPHCGGGDNKSRVSSVEQTTSAL